MDGILRLSECDKRCLHPHCVYIVSNSPQCHTINTHGSWYYCRFNVNALLTPSLVDKLRLNHAYIMFM